METAHFRHEDHQSDFDYDYIYSKLISKLRRRLRKALFIAGSSQYFSNETKISDKTHCNAKIFNHAEKIIEAEPLLSTDSPRNQKPNTLTLRMEQLAHRNAQLLENALKIMKNRQKMGNIDTIDGQIAYLISQIRDIS